MTTRAELEKKIHDSPNSSRADQAALVFYDHTGRWIFEMYVPKCAKFVIQTETRGK